MEIQKLVKQVKKEAKANPGRTGVLALVVVIAIYFWVPLVLKWCGYGKGPKAPPVAAGSPAAAPAVAVAAMPSYSDMFRWEGFLQRIEQDKTMTSTPLPELSHNPFERWEEPEQVTEVIDATTAPPTQTAAIVPFDQLGIRLQSTMIGPKGGTAIIGDKMYTVETADPSPRPITIELGGNSINLNLIAVRHGEVELEYAGATHVLSIDADSIDSGLVQRN